MAEWVNVAFSGWASNMVQIAVDKIADVLISKCMNTRVEDSTPLKDQLLEMRLILTKFETILSVAVVNDVRDTRILFWLNHLQDALYNAEDILDQFELSDVQGTPQDFQEARKALSSFLKKSNDLMHQYGGFNLDAAIGEFGMRNKFAKNLLMMHESSSIFHGYVVLGRDGDKAKLVEKMEDLASQNISPIPIISIVGFAGIGKTTVAQVIYNDLNVKKAYQVRVWVSMHNSFNLKLLMKTIIESIIDKKFEESSVECTEVKFQNLMEGKKFLLVLDGVWHERRSDWCSFFRLLSVGSQESIVLVTTQSPTVSSIIGSTYSHSLESLSEEDCWLIFKKHAFVSEENALANRELIRIGRQIISTKCCRNPLVSKTLGNLLFGKEQESEWYFINDTEIACLPAGGNALSLALKLSYYYLPTYLRICVPYCALFSRDYEFNKDSLVQLWMAEECVRRKGRIRMEDLADSYFEEMVKRSFFQQVVQNAIEDDTTPKYKMHALAYQMIQLVAVDDSFRLISTNKSILLHNSTFLRHLSVSVNNLNFEEIQKFTKLRTFLLLFKNATCINHIPVDLFDKIKFVRVLDLSTTAIQSLPASIIYLKFLKYLNVSGTPITFIPDELCDIQKLQTLKVNGCLLLEALPTRLQNLVHLRHLDIDEDSSFDSPFGIGKLTQLQELRRFAVHNVDGCMINELQNMDQLRGSLCISKLENLGPVSQEDFSQGGYLNNKSHLTRLKLQWTSSPNGQDIPGNILKLFKPHPNLKMLVVEGYLNKDFTQWEWSDSTSVLENVELKNCSRFMCISGLLDFPRLKQLSINGNDSVIMPNLQSFFGFIDKRFESLETLKFDSWTNWTKWEFVREGDMPELREIFISNCPVLTTVPDFGKYAKLIRLELHSCGSLKTCIAESRPPQLALLNISRCPGLGGDLKSNDITEWPFNSVTIEDADD